MCPLVYSRAPNHIGKFRTSSKAIVWIESLHEPLNITRDTTMSIIIQYTSNNSILNTIVSDVHHRIPHTYGYFRICISKMCVAFVFCVNLILTLYWSICLKSVPICSSNIFFKAITSCDIVDPYHSLPFTHFDHSVIGGYDYIDHRHRQK